MKKAGFKPYHYQHQAGKLRLLDQRLLPRREKWISCRTSREVYQAIRTMVVRGAPAIGIVGGYGLCLAVARFRGKNTAQFLKFLRKEAAYLKSSRPTGVNLRNVIDQMVQEAVRSKLTSVKALQKLIEQSARRLDAEDDRKCRRMGAYGSSLIPRKSNVLTHCNAGGLATSGYGTALGVFYAAHERGKKIHVFADETRPLLQGARLTAWELLRSGIPCTLLCDNAAANLLRTGKIACIVVGADRIAANGDTANKIGTYNLAVLAKEHRIPFYIAAPSTTFDFQIADGREIPIEDRLPEEVTHGFGAPTAPKNIRVLNPAFDVTPARLITAFITEQGILRPPYLKSFKKIKSAVKT